MRPHHMMPAAAHLQMPRPGHTFALDRGQLVEVPLSADHLLRATHAMGLAGGLGQHPQDAGDKLRDDPAIRAQYDLIPAFYTVSILLGTAVPSQAANSTQIRPENFILERISWATLGDSIIASNDGMLNAAGGSVDGRCVEVSWSDEFTKFLGQNPCLVSALFGDSQGYLDIPRGILFQGKQTLQVSLSRLAWLGPTGEGQPASTRWDFNFQGVGLLPKNAGGTSGALR